MGRKTRLTTELIDAIVKRIRVGVFPYIAAQAVGIPKSTFYDWMRRGEKGRKPFSELLAKVRTAAATARSSAEVRVFRDQPFQWLRYGPGRERADEPGWTESPQTLRVEGGDTPVQVDRTVCPVSRSTIAEALLEMQRLGFLTITPQGQPLLESPGFSPVEEGGSVIDATSEPSGNGDGQEPTK